MLSDIGPDSSRHSPRMRPPDRQKNQLHVEMQTSNIRHDSGCRRTSSPDEITWLTANKTNQITTTVFAHVCTSASQKVMPKCPYGKQISIAPDQLEASPR